MSLIQAVFARYLTPFTERFHTALDELEARHAGERSRRGSGCWHRCQPRWQLPVARAGGGVPLWFEGGQMPLSRRLPKRGFTNIFKKAFQLVNLDDLEARMEAGKVDGESLVAAGLVKYADRPVKLLGRGSVSKKFEIEVAKASKSAIAAVEAAGGTVTVKG